MRKKCKRPLTFLLALLLFFSLTGASVQAEESTKAGSSDKAQTVVIQEDSTQKEDDVGAAASTEEYTLWLKKQKGFMAIQALRL